MVCLCMVWFWLWWALVGIVGVFVIVGMMVVIGVIGVKWVFVKRRFFWEFFFLVV